MSKAYTNSENCKGCGLCVHYCPRKAITITEQLNSKGYKYAEVNMDKCIGCGICYTVCPDIVFTITDEA